MAKQINYRQKLAQKEDIKQELRKRFPEMKTRPAIYIYWKYTEKRELRMYVGQTIDLLERTYSHSVGHSHIDLSLKKWGWYDKDTNPYGWRLHFYYCPKNELDKMERFEIEKYKDRATLYNITSGGQGEGKVDINERKPTKTYKQGVAYGELKTKRKVKEFFDKYLDFNIKEPSNKIKERKLAEFGEFLKIKEESGE